MALECGCIARNCAYCDDGLSVILDQKANRVLHPLNGYRHTTRPNPRMQSDRFAHEIAPILTRSYAARSRRLMRSALGGHERPIGLTISARFSTVIAVV